MGKLLGIAYKERSKGPMVEIDLGDVLEATGLNGEHRGSSKNRQVTILFKEKWDDACAKLGVNLNWFERRANFLVEGVVMDSLEGKSIRIGEVELLMTMETVPCLRMEEVQLGLQEALKPKYNGGMCCKVTKGGQVHIGDKVELI